MRRWPVVVMVVTLALAACSDEESGSASTTMTAPATTMSTRTSTTTSTTTSTSSPESTSTTVAPTVVVDHVSELYAGTEHWICHPDVVTDVCRDLTTTVIAPDGSQTVEQLAPADAPGFDCFYAYPTTSADPDTNSDLAFDDSEADTVRAQVARYASVCRVFAPVYRSITLVGLGRADAAARDIAYGDVVDAWRSYVVDRNDGRGVVLIGHSQGAGHLGRLLDEEIGPNPAARQLLVSAVLLGTSVPGDGFEGISPCSSADQAGCVVSFSSYPADSPPATGALFGIVRDTGQPALCVDPAALLGGDGVVDTVLPTRLSLLGGVTGFEGITTPFVELTDAVRIACAEANGYGYLGVERAGVPGDVRNLDGLVEQRLGPMWGLHLLDANLAQDALIELVARQAEAWTATGPP